MADKLEASTGCVDSRPDLWEIGLSADMPTGYMEVLIKHSIKPSCSTPLPLQGAARELLLQPDLIDDTIFGLCDTSFDSGTMNVWLAPPDLPCLSAGVFTAPELLAIV